MSTKLNALEAIYEAQRLAFGPIYFQAILSLKKLGILELVSKHRKGIQIAEICKQLNYSDYGVRVLLEAAESANVVEFLDKETVTLTMTGVFINMDKMTEVNFNFVEDICYRGAQYTKESILEGKPAGLKTLGNWDTVYQGLSELNPEQKKSWFEFDHFYSDNAFPAALEIVFKDHPKYIFDIGGNTGKWSFACCNHDPQVNVKILDLPVQIKVAKANAVQQGLSNRIDYHPINLLDESMKIPKGADAVWMSQFLDCFSESEIVAILKNVAQAADSHTNIFILETFIDNQKFPAAKYCLTATSLYFTFIANGNSKMYSEGVMTDLVNKAGLKVIETFPLIGDSYHTILKCKLA